MNVGSSCRSSRLNHEYLSDKLSWQQCSESDKTFKITFRVSCFGQHKSVVTLYFVFLVFLPIHTWQRIYHPQTVKFHWEHVLSTPATRLLDFRQRITESRWNAISASQTSEGASTVAKHGEQRDQPRLDTCIPDTRGWCPVRKWSKLIWLVQELCTTSVTKALTRWQLTTLPGFVRSLVKTTAQCLLS